MKVHLQHKLAFQVPWRQASLFPGKLGVACRSKRWEAPEGSRIGNMGLPESALREA